MTEAEKIAACARIAQANPSMSLREIYRQLNLKPRNYAGAFKKGSDAHANEVADYAAELALYNSRNAR